MMLSRFATVGRQPHVPGAAFLAAAVFNLLGLALAARFFARASVSGAQHARGS
jgi:hypothetical protein